MAERRSDQPLALRFWPLPAKVASAGSVPKDRAARQLSGREGKDPMKLAKRFARSRPPPTASGLLVASRLSDRVDLEATPLFRLQEFMPLLLAEMRHVNGGCRIVHDQPQDRSWRHCAQALRGLQHWQRAQESQGIEFFVIFHRSERYAACFSLSTEL